MDVFVRDRRRGVTRRVSVASDGREGNDDSGTPAISGDGRYVAFASGASNLVSGDTNEWVDVFVRDRRRGVTSRVSIASDGRQGDEGSFRPTISADGRYVAFESGAGSLVAGDTNEWVDVFVRDRRRGVTSSVSVASDGTHGNGDGYYPAISADGRHIAFVAEATNLSAGPTSPWIEVVVRDQRSGITSTVSVRSDERWANDGTDAPPAISADGRYVAFTSFASNLVAGDTNHANDVFVRDRRRGVTSRVSVASNGREGNGGSSNPAISADGRYVAFTSFAGNVVGRDTNGANDVFVRDRLREVTSRVSVRSDGSQGNLNSGRHAISADGGYVAFYSFAANLVPGDTNSNADVFLHERLGAARLCIAPNLKGRTVAQARRLLAAKKCRLGKAMRAYSNTVREGRIISQTSRPGVRLPERTKVNIVVSRGRRPD